MRQQIGWLILCGGLLISTGCSDRPKDRKGTGTDTGTGTRSLSDDLRETGRQAKELGRQVGETAESAAEAAKRKWKESEPEREAMKRKMDQELKDLDGKMDVWRDKAAKATGDAKVKLQAELKELEARRKEVGERMQPLQENTGKAWDEVRGGLENAWGELRSSFEKAKQKFE